MSSPQMRKWIYHKAKTILEQLDELPYSDDVDEKKLAVIRTGLRESSVELFRRAAEQTTAALVDSDELKEVNSAKASLQKIIAEG